MNKNGFQKEFISHGKISCVCPFTGEMLYSDTGIPYLFPPTQNFFRFNSREPFYLITGFYTGEKNSFVFS